LLGIARNDCAAASAKVGGRRAFGIQPGFDLFRRRVRSMTTPAPVGEYRAYVTVEINLAGGSGVLNGPNSHAPHQLRKEEA
jgi:hypothetical protein